MIKSISLKNFRSYKDTFLEFHSGISILTGANDSGKTNILRGLNWLIHNRPLGDDIRSDFGGDTIVSIEVNDKLISRIKTNNENLYVLTHADGKEDKFRAFKSGVPEIIAQHLNISPTNIAFQLDGPFLLSKSASDVAKFYNEIVNLEIIDSTISNIAGTLRKEKTSLKVEKETEKKKLEELKEYDWLPEAEAELIKLEKMQQAIIRLKADWTNLYKLTEDLKRLAETERKLSKITKHDVAVTALLEQKGEIEKLKKDHLSLEELIYNFKRLTSVSRELNEIVKHEGTLENLLYQWEDIKLLRTDTKVLTFMVNEIKRLRKEESECREIVKHSDEATRLAELHTQMGKDTDRSNALFDLVEQWENLNKQLSGINNGLANLELEFQETMPEKCPIFDVECMHVEEARK